MKRYTSSLAEVYYITDDDYPEVIVGFSRSDPKPGEHKPTLISLRMEGGPAGEAHLVLDPGVAFMVLKAMNDPLLAQLVIEEHTALCMQQCLDSSAAIDQDDDGNAVQPDHETAALLGNLYSEMRRARARAVAAADALEQRAAEECPVDDDRAGTGPQMSPPDGVVRH